MSVSIVNQFKDIFLDYDAASTLTVKFYTAMPGGAMTLRRTLTFAATSGRQADKLPFDDSGNSYALVEGSLFKVRFESAGAVRLFGGRVSARKIGVYIDGANGEIWETLELAI